MTSRFSHRARPRFDVARRRLLIGAAALAVSPVSGAAAPLRQPISVLGLNASAAELGAIIDRAAVLDTSPPVSAELLLKKLAADGFSLDQTDRFAWASAIRKRIRADFAEQDVVVVLGWMLSTTEARLFQIAKADQDDGLAVF